MRGGGRLTHKDYRGKKRGVMILSSKLACSQSPAKGLPHGAGAGERIDWKVTGGCPESRMSETRMPQEEERDTAAQLIHIHPCVRVKGSRTQVAGRERSCLNSGLPSTQLCRG